MKNCKSLLCMLGLVLAFRIAVAAADAPPLTFTFTPVSVRGSIEALSGGVNNAGVIVGRYEDKNKKFHGFMLNGKILTTIDDPKGTQGTSCGGINPNGAISIVGAYTNDGHAVGFLYKNGKFTDIPGPAGAVSSTADGINDAGDIVGYYTDSNAYTHGFLLKGNTYTTLDVPQENHFTLATGINNNGDIVLVWINPKLAFESSLYNGKTYTIKDVPNATSSIATGINAAGDISYEWSNSTSGGGGAALLYGGKYYKFNYPSSVKASSAATGLNDRHLIVGTYNSTSKGHPYQIFKATYK
jgi:probable HAF family extracellular repeat protein